MSVHTGTGSTAAGSVSGGAASASTWGLAAAALVLGALAAWAALSLAVGGDGAGAAPGSQRAAAAGAEGDDDAPLGTALAAAVAAEPDDVASRLALAHHHFEASAFDTALAHYLEVLARQPGNGRALARAGWIAYEGGEDGLARELLERSLLALPDDPEALWFLAQVRLDGAGDGVGAGELLRRLLERDDLSPAFREQVLRLAEDAREAGS